MYRIPLGNWIVDVFNFITAHFGFAFNALVAVINYCISIVSHIYTLPVALQMALALALTLYLGGIWLAAFTAVSMLLVYDMGLWLAAAQTLGLMTVAALACIAIGIPLGIALTEAPFLWRIAEPILDFLQTLHPFVYLIPVVVALGLGGPPAVISAMLYTIALPVRLTYLGLRSVSPEAVEAGEAFGGSRWQVLVKVKIPLALPTILAGINQAILITLSFIVIAALIGAGGLGSNILTGISQLQLGVGFEAGLSVVLVAIVLDRTARGLVSRVSARMGLESKLSTI